MDSQLAGSTSVQLSLLDLPGEIRNILYRLLLNPYLPTTIYKLVANNHCSAYVLDSCPVHAEILATCRQIHAEGTPILYAENTFVAHNTLLTALPHLLNPSRQLRTPGLSSRIQRWYVNVRLDCDARYTEKDVTDAFSGCESLTVEASQAMFRGASSAHLMLFKNVRGVRTANVCGSVPDEVARWLEAAMMADVGHDCGDYADSIELTIVDGIPQLYNAWQHGNR